MERRCHEAHEATENFIPFSPAPFNDTIMTIQIDCRGLNCPEPVLRAKTALEEGHSAFTLIVDNEAARDNVLRFGQSRNCLVEVEKEREGAFILSFTVENPKGTTKTADSFQANDYPCPVPAAARNIVLVISADTMGRGNDELGWALLQTYITTIQEVTPLPTRILFYNGGVKVVASSGKALESLKLLEKQGVQILSCATCLDYFKLSTNLEVGTSANMYEIMHSMNNADQVVSPF
jgi:selenium metabolism protein YedF